MLNLAQQLHDPAGVESFLRAFWQIVPDPEDAEYIRDPRYQLREWASRGTLEGDCDDSATLAAALLAALGWPASFIAIRMPGQTDYSHVFVRSPFTYGYPIDIDPIVPAEHLPITDYAQALEVMV